VSTRLRRRRKPNDRWWRISDEKVKECKTSDVLGMQKEVYLLFYEMERPDFSPAAAVGRL
jgi:ubiquitin carboxyl-terminal hydrolase 16